MKLRTRAEASEVQAARRTLPSMGAEQTPHHGTLQRLLGGSGIIQLNNGTRRTEFGVERSLPWIPLVAQ